MYSSSLFLKCRPSYLFIWLCDMLTLFQCSTLNAFSHWYISYAYHILFLMICKFPACQIQWKRVCHWCYFGYTDVLHKICVLMGHRCTASRKQALLRQTRWLRVWPAVCERDSHWATSGRRKQHQLTPKPGSGGHIYQPQLLSASAKNGQFLLFIEE